MKHILTAILTAIASIAYATAQTDSVAIADTSKDTDIATAAEPAPGLLAQQADSAYAQDNFALAERLYLESIKQDGTSSTIFYNLGNAYYRQGNLGKAIVNYERALKLDPTNADARDNLDFVKSKITDRQIDEGSIMTKLWHNVISTFKADTWAWIAVILFALFLAGAFTYMLSSVILIKKLFRRHDYIHALRADDYNIVCSSQPRNRQQICHNPPPVSAAVNHPSRGTHASRGSIPATRRDKSRNRRLHLRFIGGKMV